MGLTQPFYTAQEVARDFVGVALDVFYRTREIRHTRDHLPRPYQIRPMRFERSGMDAWKSRNHPLRPAAAPANDISAPLAPHSDDEHLAALHAYYRKMKHAAG